MNRKRTKCMESKKNKGKQIVSLATLVTVIAIVAIAVFLHPAGKIANGVSVCGMHIGGMAREDAKTAILSAYAGDVDGLVVYAKGGSEIEIPSSELAFSFDIEKTLDAAFSVGRTGNFFENVRELARTRFMSKDVGYSYSFDKEKLADIIYNFGASVNGEYVPYFLEYREDTVIATRGRGGQSKDVSLAVAVIEDAIKKGYRKIFVPLKLETEPAANLRSLYDETYLAAKNAEYVIENGRIVITPEVTGRQIDMIDAATKIESLRKGEPTEIKLVKLEPEVGIEELNEKLFNYTLAQYTTSYSQKDKGRSANVALAAKKINGVVLVPGEVFSYNDVVGPRTTAAGFKSAPVFENGQTVQGVGGGICQVSSTLYSAVLYADLDIVSRLNHSMTVAYVPKGQDATVVYGSTDFKFKNSTGYPIQIVASAVGGKMSVSIRGTKPEKEKTVKIIHNVVSEIEPGVEEVYDQNVAVGAKEVISAGKSGYVVSTTRIVYEGGKEIKNEKMGTSTYKMVPAKVAIGSKVPEPLATLPPRATPNPEPAPEEVNAADDEVFKEEVIEEVPESEITPIPTMSDSETLSGSSVSEETKADEE